jgi:hypothetical protein
LIFGSKRCAIFHYFAISTDLPHVERPEAVAPRYGFTARSSGVEVAPSAATTSASVIRLRLDGQPN